MRVGAQLKGKISAPVPHKSTFQILGLVSFCFGLRLGLVFFCFGLRLGLVNFRRTQTRTRDFLVCKLIRKAFFDPNKIVHAFCTAASKKFKCDKHLHRLCQDRYLLPIIIKVPKFYIFATTFITFGSMIVKTIQAVAWLWISYKVLNYSLVTEGGVNSSQDESY